MSHNQITQLLAIPAIPAVIWLLCKRYLHKYVVLEGHIGLFYRDGILMDALPAGRHVFWGSHCSVTLVDIRKTIFHFAAERMLTADKVGVKLDLVLTTQIVDAVKMARAVNNHTGHLCSAVEKAVRDIVAGIGVDDLHGRRSEISARLCNALDSLADTIGLHVHNIQVRDVANDVPASGTTTAPGA